MTSMGLRTRATPRRLGSSHGATKAMIFGAAELSPKNSPKRGVDVGGLVLERTARTRTQELSDYVDVPNDDATGAEGSSDPTTADVRVNTESDPTQMLSTLRLAMRARQSSKERRASRIRRISAVGSADVPSKALVFEGAIPSVFGQGIAGNTLAMAAMTGLSDRREEKPNEGAAPSTADALRAVMARPAKSDIASSLSGVVEERVQDLDVLESELKAMRLDQCRLAGPSSRHQILPRLWLGGSEATLPPGTTHVVTVEEPEVSGKGPLPYPLIPGSRRILVTVGDMYDDDIARCFGTAYDLLKEVETSKKNFVAYVHCRTGRCQSAAIVIAYLVLRGASLLSAFYHVALRRDIALNVGFFAALGNLETQKHGQCSFPFYDYWRITVLRIEYRSNVQVSYASDQDIEVEWARQANGSQGEGSLGRVVAGFRAICCRLKNSDPQIKALVKRLDENARRESDADECIGISDLDGLQM